MRRFEVGDRVQIDIPDTDDPDFDEYHGRTGEIIEILEDDADEQTGDERDAYLFMIEFTTNRRGQFRWRDLRPASSE